MRQYALIPSNPNPNPSPNPNPDPDPDPDPDPNLIIKVGIVDELDLPGNPLASAMYEGLTALVNMLPLVAALVAILSKVGGVCPYIESRLQP